MVSSTRFEPELVQRAQEIAYDHPDSRFMFDKPLVVTRAAWNAFGPQVVLRIYAFLQDQARRCSGLDHAQVFDDAANVQGPNLWFIEDAETVTALLPSDY